MSPNPAVKLVAFLKKKPEISTEQFQAYYENKHVPLVLRTTPCISRYIRNYIQHDTAIESLDSATTSFCDVVTEAWFETEDDWQKFQQLATDPGARKKIIDDELNFLDRESMKMFLVKECGGSVSS